MVAEFTKFCEGNDLRSYDPYDVWKTKLGIAVKDTFNRNRLIGALPALILSITDLMLNNDFRIGYQKQEYPIVRALAAQTLLNQYERTGEDKYLSLARKHLSWLVENSSIGYSGFCWGLGFKWPAADNVVYDANTPHSTHTPYALEAFHKYTQISGNNDYVPIIKSCFNFFENDLCVMHEDEKSIAISYGPFKDRIATNAVSYALYSYAIFTLYFPEKQAYLKSKISKLYTYIISKQRTDGSWLYSPDDESSFIDCFHSCFILKNLIKTNKIQSLEQASKYVLKGYEYLCKEFYDNKARLYKRFTKAKNLSLVKYDLYDNAEMLSLCNMLNDTERRDILMNAIQSHFIKGSDIYSAKDIIGIRRNKNTLRWALMPYLYALSTLK